MSTTNADSEARQGITGYIDEMLETSEVLAASGDLTQVLNTLAGRARTLTQARYAAISVFDQSDGSVERFIYDGIDEALARRMGDPPRGRGLLGELASREYPLRLDDLRKHSTFTGWPPDHPEMARFLGVPIRAGGQTIGSLYMTRLEGEPPFSDGNELSAALLALQAAASLATAIAREKEGRLSLLEERERIAHDLHDGTIQSLYALGLECDALTIREEYPEEVRTELSSFVDRINGIIGDIRGYITSLEAKTPATTPDLKRDLPFVVRQLVPEGIDTVVNISAAALQEISSRQAEDMIYIAREALSNAVRHGEPTRVAVDLRQDDLSTTLTIQDNGKGFDQASARTGLGTITMRTRAERLGGNLLVLSIPGMGTTVRLTVTGASDE
jgi:signal transduction histidine kinase